MNTNNSNTATVKHVETKQQVKQFIKMAFDIYANDPNWVAPLNMDSAQRLDPKQEPFYQNADLQMFMAYNQNNKIVGRIAAIDNKLFNQIHANANMGFWGFFECENNQTTANALFEAAAQWLKPRGLNRVQGPASPSSNHEYGLLTEGFDDPPRLMMTYNPPYYRDLILNYGFERAKGLVAFKLDQKTLLSNEKFVRVAAIAQQRSKVTVRKINMRHLADELKIFKHIYNNAWEHNWGFIPFTDPELDAMAKDLKMLIADDLVLFAEIDGQPIGFALAIPDYNLIFKSFKGNLFPFNFFKLFTQKKRINWARVMVLGLLPQYQGRGIDSVLYHELILRARKMGIDYAEASWILEDNLPMMRAAENVLNGIPYKKYEVYEKDI